MVRAAKRARSSASCCTDAGDANGGARGLSPVPLPSLMSDERLKTPEGRQPVKRMAHKYTLPSPERGISPQTRRDHIDVLDTSTIPYRKFMLEDALRREMKYQPSPCLCGLGSERSGLVDWLIKTHKVHRCTDFTLFFTVNIMDRVVQSKWFKKNSDPDLAVVCAYFIASKYEERKTFSVDEYIRLLSVEIKRKEFFDVEKQILGVLNFNLTVITPLNFLDDYLDGADAGDEAEMYAHFLLELTLLSKKFVGAAPSILAAAAVALATKTLEGSARSGSDYPASKLDETVKLMCKSYASLSVESCLFEKYTEDRCYNVAYIHPII